MIPMVTQEKAGWTFFTSHPCLGKNGNGGTSRQSSGTPHQPHAQPPLSTGLTGPQSETVHCRSQGGPVQFFSPTGLVLGSHSFSSSEQRMSLVTTLRSPHLAVHCGSRGRGRGVGEGVATSISQAQLPSSSSPPACSRRHSPRTTLTSPTGARRRGSGRSFVPQAARPRLPHTGHCTRSCRSQARASSSSARRGTGSPLRRCANTHSSCSSPTCPGSGWPSTIPPWRPGPHATHTPRDNAVPPSLPHVSKTTRHKLSWTGGCRGPGVQAGP